LQAFAGRKGYTILTGSGADLDGPLSPLFGMPPAPAPSNCCSSTIPTVSHAAWLTSFSCSRSSSAAASGVEFLTMPREESPEGRLLLNVRAVVSEFEREKIRERTLRGKREKARRGLIVAGPTPFGYRRARDEPGRLWKGTSAR
jgi:resolvase-like protein